MSFRQNFPSDISFPMSWNQIRYSCIDSAEYISEIGMLSQLMEIENVISGDKISPRHPIGRNHKDDITRHQGRTQIPSEPGWFYGLISLLCSYKTAAN